MVSGQLLRAQLGRELDDRHREALRLGDDPRRNVAVDRALHHRGQEVVGVLFGEVADADGRDPLQQVLPVEGVTQTEEQHDAVRVQPASHQAQRRKRLAIEPLRIINHTHERLVESGCGEEREGGQPGDESIRRRAVDEPER